MSTIMMNQKMGDCPCEVESLM